MIELEKMDVIFLQETLGVGETIINMFKALLPGWTFHALDAHGRFNGCAMGINNISMKFENIWGRVVVLAIDAFSIHLGHTLRLVNIYGPYHNRVDYWESLMQVPFMANDNIIIGGDLIFSLGHAKSWGNHVQIDPLSDFFEKLLEHYGYLNIEVARIQLTCGIVGLVRLCFLEGWILFDRIREWVGSDDISDLSPILLEIVGTNPKPKTPFKFNSSWLKYKEFHQIVKDTWITCS